MTKLNCLLDVQECLQNIPWQVSTKYCMAKKVKHYVQMPKHNKRCFEFKKNRIAFESNILHQSRKLPKHSKKSRLFL